MYKVVQSNIQDLAPSNIVASYQKRLYIHIVYAHTILQSLNKLDEILLRLDSILLQYVC